MNNVKQSDTVLIVAAGKAILDFEKYGCYICQENRNFRSNSEYMAFYHHNKISTYVPKILGYINSIKINSPKIDSKSIVNVSSTQSELESRLNEFLSNTFTNPDWTYTKNKIIILSYQDDPRTIILPHEIQNNKTSKNGNIRVPYTQSNRYSTLSKLKKSYFTKELEE